MKFIITIQGTIYDGDTSLPNHAPQLTLAEIWEKLDVQELSFRQKLNAWSDKIVDFRDAITRDKNPYLVLIKGTPLEKNYDSAKRFAKTLLAYNTLYNRKDESITRILNREFKKSYKDIGLFDAEFPNLRKEFITQWYLELLRRSFDLDD
jgi:hypothetical protein